MNRLHKKCFIASAGFHLLLALILFVGPAFVSSNNKSDDVPVLDFTPWKTVDALIKGGGNPGAQPLAAAPQPQPAAPAPPPQPEKVRDPDPPKETVKETKPPKPEESLEPNPDAKPKKKEIVLKPVSRPSNTKEEAKARADAQAREQAKAAADARRQLASQLGRAADRMGSELSGGTTIELKGPGGGGVPYANFLQAVKTAYANAWVVPEGVADDNAITTASVTIARDGTVVSARISHRSGDGPVDASVQATLDRVRFAAPLPDDAKEDRRTVIINFNVKTKLGA